MPGRQPKLSGEQMRQLYTLIAGTDPRQLEFGFTLWTRDMLRTLIRREFRVSLSAVNVGGCCAPWACRRSGPCGGPGRPTPTLCSAGATRTSWRSARRARPRAPRCTSATRPGSARTTTPKLVKQFVASTDGRLRLFVLPAYSPQLNPDEWVLKNLTQDRVGRTSVTDADDFKVTIIGALRRLQKAPHIVRAVFADPTSSDPDPDRAAPSARASSLKSGRAP